MDIKHHTRKVDTIQDSNKVKLVEYLCKDDNDTSGLQNENTDEGNIDETNEGSEADNTQGGANEITAEPWTFTKPQVRKKENDEEKTVHCILCSESFFINLD